MSTQSNAQQITVVDGRPSSGASADVATRSIRGAVQPDGTIYDGGNGFSVTKDGTGAYTITFDPPFSDIPAFSLTPGGTLSSLYTNPLWVSNSSLSFTYMDAQGNPTDSWFFLIAVGGA